MSIISASTTTTTAYKVTADTTGTLVLQTGASPTTAVTIDTAQNMGLGVTPSAWATSGTIVKALQIGVAGSIAAGVSDPTTHVSQNGYFDGTNWRYIQTNVASNYYQNGGSHVWRTAGSGTAGTAITFTQAMTLDASGTLSLASGNLALPGSAPIIQISSNKYFGVGSSLSGSYASTDLAVWNGASGNLVFLTNATERARIDSSGNLLVGATSGFGRFNVKTTDTSSGTWGVYMRNSADSIMFAFLNNGNFYTGNGAGSPYNNTTASAANVVVSSDSGLLLRSTSSLKYKTDVQDATHGLADVLKLRAVTYKGKNDGDKVFGGLIAEEVDAAGLTEFVQYADDGTPDALAYGNMVSLCIKAIQEQQAIIETLTNRIQALENK